MLYTLGEAALRTALLAGILQLTLSLLHVRRTRLLLAAWTIVLAISMAMPFLLRSSPLPIPLDESVPRALIDGATDLMQQQSMAAPAVISSIETRTLPSIEAWLGIIYVVVGCGLGLRVLLGVALSLRILARATPTRPEWAAGVRVRLSQDVAGPVTIARTIVLPSDSVQWPADTRRAVLAHEHAHVSQLDYAMLIVAQLNRAVFWFSPISWWLYHRLAVLTELVSDDRAIEVTRDRVAYAEILLKMARRPEPMARGPSMARFSTLPLRIDRILLDQMSSCRVGRLQWATLTIGVVAASLTVANLAPSIVSRPTPPILGDVSIHAAEAPPRDASPAELPPPDSVLKPPIARDIAPFVARAQQPRVATRLHPTVHAPTKTALPPPPTKTDQAVRLGPCHATGALAPGSFSINPCVRRGSAR